MQTFRVGHLCTFNAAVIFFGAIPTYGVLPYTMILLCQVEEHQHQLAHQCLPNIIGIWEWGICGLMGGAFITFNGWSIYGLLGWTFMT